MTRRLKEVLPGQYKYESRPTFVNYPKGGIDGKWHVWGPAEKIVEGKVCEVYNYSEAKMVPVEVLKHVAFRDVLHRNGERVRYVMATYDKVVSDGDGE
jgi:hypothetical protein